MYGVLSVVNEVVCWQVRRIFIYSALMALLLIYYLSVGIFERLCGIFSSSCSRLQLLFLSRVLELVLIHLSPNRSYRSCVKVWRAA